MTFGHDLDINVSRVLVDASHFRQNTETDVRRLLALVGLYGRFWTISISGSGHVTSPENRHLLTDAT